MVFLTRSHRLDASTLLRSLEASLGLIATRDNLTFSGDPIAALSEQLNRMRIAKALNGGHFCYVQSKMTSYKKTVVTLTFVFRDLRESSASRTKHPRLT
jgi:hypothetical protein